MSDSDVEMKRIPATKPVKKAPKSPTEEILKAHDPKKITTKAMIHEALKELHTRKGVSYYAIKKYLEEKHKVETEKVKHLIKKAFKSGVEDGTIIQMKGIGASGSFKLAPKKEKPKKKIKEKESIEKPTKKEKTKTKTDKKEKVKKMEKKVKIDVKEKKEKVKKKSEVDKKVKVVKEKKSKAVEKDNVKKPSKKLAMATPAKKRAAMMKRKSIGSIIKPPKMKPKTKA